MGGFLHCAGDAGETLRNRRTGILPLFTPQGAAGGLAGGLDCCSFPCTDGHQFTCLHHRAVSRMVQLPRRKEHGEHPFLCTEHLPVGSGTPHDRQYGLFRPVAHPPGHGALRPALPPSPAVPVSCLPRNPPCLGAALRDTLQYGQ